MVKSTPVEAGAPMVITPEKLTKERKTRSTEGAAEAKAAARMSLEEWRLRQEGMAKAWPAPGYMSVPMPGRSHTAYRDETYELVTRWSEDTRISYRPHAKAPGSKSHVRYEEYSKATTVGQALELGTLPADWCWDYERGFVRVHGPLRDEPLDIAQVADKASLTEVDRVIYKWYNKELAKNLGLDYRDLCGTSEPSIVRGHRLFAQRQARERLEAAHRERRPVGDEDVEAVLKAWAFAKNGNRTNVMPDGQSWVWSDTVGLIRDRIGDIHVTPATKLYPEVMQLLVKYLKDRLPPEAAGFTFTSLNLNCNYAARLHRDGNNFGPSFIKAFGNFTGGELNYWPEDDKGMDLEQLPKDKKVQLDISKGPQGGLALFNGNCAHSVEDFKGNRYSVVYFCLGCHAKASQEDRDFLQSLGVAFPAPDQDRHALLRAPRGYGPRPLTGAAAVGLPAVLHWSNDDLAAQPFHVAQSLRLVAPLKPAGGAKPAPAAKKRGRAEAVA